MLAAADRTCDHFPHGDADVDGKGFRRRGRQPSHGGLDVEGSAHCAQGVVAVRAGRAKQRHGGIADVLVDHPAVPVDDPVHHGEESLKQRVHLLGVQLRQEPGIANDVTEHDSDRASVAFAAGVGLGANGFASTKRPAAASAKAIQGVIGVAAFFAGPGERGAARGAELPTLLVLALAMRAEHRCRSPCRSSDGVDQH